MALEATAAIEEQGVYPVDLAAEALLEIDFTATVQAIVSALREGTDRRLIASRFHQTVAEICVEAAARVCQAEDVGNVALSGGVFQNRILLRAVAAGLRRRGLTPYCNRVVPANDAGISLGQALILRSRLEA